MKRLNVIEYMRATVTHIHNTIITQYTQHTDQSILSLCFGMILYTISQYQISDYLCAATDY